MVKFVLINVVVQYVPGNECKVVPTPTILFEDHYECSIYGYEYAIHFFLILIEKICKRTWCLYKIYMYTKKESIEDV